MCFLSLAALQTPGLPQGSVLGTPGCSGLDSLSDGVQFPGEVVSSPAVYSPESSLGPDCLGVNLDLPAESHVTFDKVFNLSVPLLWGV